jgi:hypothetical protein
MPSRYAVKQNGAPALRARLLRDEGLPYVLVAQQFWAIGGVVRCCNPALPHRLNSSGPQFLDQLGLAFRLSTMARAIGASRPLKA